MTVQTKPPHLLPLGFLQKPVSYLAFLFLPYHPPFPSAVRGESFRRVKQISLVNQWLRLHLPAAVVSLPGSWERTKILLWYARKKIIKRVNSQMWHSSAQLSNEIPSLFKLKSEVLSMTHSTPCFPISDLTLLFLHHTTKIPECRLAPRAFAWLWFPPLGLYSLFPAQLISSFLVSALRCQLSQRPDIPGNLQLLLPHCLW